MSFKIAEAFIDVKAEVDDGSVKDAEKSFGGSAKKIGKSAGKTIAGGFVAAAAGGAAMVKSSAEAMDTTMKSARSAGMNAEAYQELAYAAELSGMSTEGFDKSAGRLNQRMGKAAAGNKKFSEAFDGLGVSIKDANGNMRDSDAVMMDTIGALEQIEDPAERAAAAAEIFGVKAGRDMASMIDAGKGGLQEMRDEAKETGSVMGEDALQDAEKFNDGMDKMMTTIQGVVTKVGAQLLPIINELLPVFEEHLVPIIDEVAGVMGDVLPMALDILSPLLEQLAPILSSIFSAIKPLLPIFVDLATMLIQKLLPVFADIIAQLASRMGPLFEKLGPIILRLADAVLTLIAEGLDALIPVIFELLDALLPVLPVILDLAVMLIETLVPVLIPLIKLVAELATLFITMLEPVLGLVIGAIKIMSDVIMAVLGPAIEWLQTPIEFISGIIGDLASAFEGAGDVIGEVWTGVKNVVKGVANSIIGFINAIINGWNAMDFAIPEKTFSVFGKKFTVGGVSIGLPDISNIPQLAKGGSLTAAGMAMVGEEGPELLNLPKGASVTPLDKTEHNESITIKNMTVKANNAEEFMDSMKDMRRGLRTA